MTSSPARATQRLWLVLAVLLSASSPAAAIDKVDPPSVGVTLGAGGANGLAHLLVLEQLDDMGIAPCHVTGASIGAVLGALYAAGLPAREIRGAIDRLVRTNTKTTGDRRRSSSRFWSMLRLYDLELERGGLIEFDGLAGILAEHLEDLDFADLPIPLTLVATDYWTHELVVLDSGAVLPAVRASMAVPGLFPPIEIDGDVLIDGGTLNPLPYDLLDPECDISVAVDVVAPRDPEGERIPSFLDSIFSSFHIMQRGIISQKLRGARPDIYLRPAVTGVRTLEFYRASEVYEQAAGVKLELRSQLTPLMTLTHGIATQ